MRTVKVILGPSPCTTYLPPLVCPHALESGEFNAAGDLRQCGIQFEPLNPNQLFLLRGFINRCALETTMTNKQPEVPETSHQ